MPPLCEASIAALIQRCTSITSLRTARQLHALIITSSLSPYPYNNVISFYARCGATADSRLVFDSMPQRNVVSFNALMAAYSRNPADAPLAAELLAQMEAESLRPNGSTFTSLLQASSSLDDWILGSLLHARVVKSGFLNDVCMQTSLLGMYSSCSDLESARRVFDCMIDKDVVAWNSMMFGNLKHGKVKETLRLFHGILKIGMIPSQITYSMALNACSRLGDYNSGQIIHAQVVISNSIFDSTLQNALLDMYCNCGDIHSASQIFCRIKSPDIVSYNTIIAGHSENGRAEEAINLFVKLQISTPIPDEYTFATIISATEALPAYGKPFHGQVVKAGFEDSVFVCSTLLSMYFRNGETEAAHKLFYSIQEKDIVLWTEMITGHSRMANGGDAIKFFHEMNREGYRIDGFALCGALSACADSATLKQGEMLHTQALKTGNDAEMSVSGSLVDMYAKNGKLKAAYSIFSQVLDPDLKCWNSMLGGYSYHGNLDQAVKLFFVMQSHGIRPDQVTFLSLLSACNHRGSVETGKFLWNFMKENGIAPGPKHFCCMVSLLSRGGLWEEAEELILKSPFTEENLELWRTLLSSSVIKKNLSVGVHAAKQILSINEEDSATYVLLSNLYAATRKWDAFSETRRTIRESLLAKDPGLSWIESQENIQVFSSGPQSHPEISGIQAELQRLRGNMNAETDEFDYVRICSSW